ncbi:MAG: YqaJ viral recombinase family protein [Alphaproteobacteria bacterium]|nr:YqaJ viral recombinase family protein [Alphaproteobacteria bacterium]
MPDPTHETVSASQIAALFDASPYDTRYTLYHEFVGDAVVEQEESERMRYGKILQPHIIADVGKRLGLEVKPTDEYLTRYPIGCTKDALIWCPTRGAGAVETKCVFDYSVWMQTWNGGTPPRHVELQLQAQMFVGDPDGKCFTWGVIAAWVCGDLHIWERAPEPELWEQMEAAARTFLHDVQHRREPDPFGAPVENAIVDQLYPTVVPEDVKDVDDVELGEAARMYDWASQQETQMKKIKAQIRPKLLHAAEDNGRLRLPGAWVNVKKSEVKATTIERKAYVQTKIDVQPVEEDLPPPTTGIAP